MLSKSLIQFSIDGWGCVPFLLSDFRRNMVEVMKIMVTFKRSHAGTATLSAPTLQQATADPHFHWRLLDTHRQSLGQSLVGSLLLSPGSWCTQVLFVPSKSLFLQSFVSSGGSMVGFMATSSKRAYATVRCAAPRAPAHVAGHC